MPSASFDVWPRWARKKPWAIIDKGNNTILGLKIASSVSDYYKFALTFLMLQVITLVSH